MAGLAVALPRSTGKGGNSSAFLAAAGSGTSTDAGSVSDGATGFTEVAIAADSLRWGMAGVSAGGASFPSGGNGMGSISAAPGPGPAAGAGVGLSTGGLTVPDGAGSCIAVGTRPPAGGVATGAATEGAVARLAAESGVSSRIGSGA